MGIVEYLENCGIKDYVVNKKKVQRIMQETWITGNIVYHEKAESIVHTKVKWEKRLHLIEFVDDFIHRYPASENYYRYNRIQVL